MPLNIDCTHCTECETLACSKACPAGSIITYGQERTVEDVLNAVAQDAIFYTRSGGGMTISGGEPLFQKDFALALLREADRFRNVVEDSARARAAHPVSFYLNELASRLHSYYANNPVLSGDDEAVMTARLKLRCKQT